MARPLSRKRKRAAVVAMLDVHRGTGMWDQPLLGFVKLLPEAGTLRNVADYETRQLDELRRLVASIWMTRRQAAEDAADRWSADDIEAAMIEAGIWPQKGGGFKTPKAAP